MSEHVHVFEVVTGRTPEGYEFVQRWECACGERRPWRDLEGDVDQLRAAAEWVRRAYMPGWRPRGRGGAISGVSSLGTETEGRGMNENDAYPSPFDSAGRRVGVGAVAAVRSPVDELLEQAERDASDAAAWREMCERGLLARVWLAVRGCGR